MSHASQIQEPTERGSLVKRLIAMLTLVLMSGNVFADVKLLKIKSMLEGDEGGRKVVLLHLKGMMDGILAENRVYFGIAGPLLERFEQSAEETDTDPELQKRPKPGQRIARSRICMKAGLSSSERDRLIVKWFYAYYEAMLAKGVDNASTLIRVGLMNDFACTGAPE